MDNLSTQLLSSMRAGGVRKSQNLCDVIYEFPLTRSTSHEFVQFRNALGTVEQQV